MGAIFINYNPNNDDNFKGGKTMMGVTRVTMPYVDAICLVIGSMKPEEVGDIEQYMHDTPPELIKYGSPEIQKSRYETGVEFDPDEGRLVFHGEPDMDLIESYVRTMEDINAMTRYQ